MRAASGSVRVGQSIGDNAGATRTCPHGHELTPDNVRVRYTRGRIYPMRECRTCLKAKRSAHQKTEAGLAYHRDYMAAHYGGSRLNRYKALDPKLVRLTDADRAALTAERERRAIARRAAAEYRATRERPKRERKPRPRKPFRAVAPVVETTRAAQPFEPMPRPKTRSTAPGATLPVLARRLSPNEQRAVAMWLAGYRPALDIV